MKPKKVNLLIYQGVTFKHTFYWYSATEVVKAITAATNAYPTVLTAAAHALPNGDTPVAIANVGDWVDTASIDKAADRIYATRIDDDTFKVKKDGTEADPYSGTGGVLVYNAPMQLASGWTARMQIRESKDSTDVLAEFTTEDLNIVLGDDGSIEVELDEAVTAALDFGGAVYDLELSDGTDVYRVAEGAVSLSNEVTR